MNINKLRESILELISLHPNDDYGTEKSWKEERYIGGIYNVYKFNE